MKENIIPVDGNIDPDINQFRVCIPNKYIPVVIPFGPRCCGKTMMVLRLCKYLLKRGYNIRAVHDFRPSSDKYYQLACDDFIELLNKNDTPKNPYGLLLIEISDEVGRPVCYLFDAEGNCYFDPASPQTSYPAFIHQIMCLPNPKQFIYVVEPHWGNIVDRTNYVQRITQCQTQFYNLRTDKVIILYNKIDITPFSLASGHVHIKYAFMDCKNLYNGLFNIFRQQNPILRWFKPYNADFIPFTSGFFYPCESGKSKYEIGLDIHPQILWKTIMKAIKK